MDPDLFVWDPDLGKIEKRDLKKKSKLPSNLWAVSEEVQLMTTKI